MEVLLMNANQSFCPSCGEPHEPGVQFCAKCGGKLGEVQQQPQGQAPAPVYPGGDAKGFFGKLFDVSFKDFITLEILSVIFIIEIVLAVLGTLAMVIIFFTISVPVGVIFLLLSPVIFILLIIFYRLQLEVTALLFRMGGHLKGIAKEKGVDTE
jgi:hypothetical protein